MLVRLLRLGRLHFLGAGLLLYLAGALWALHQGAAWDLLRLVTGYLVFFPAHLSVSYSNDYFDVAVDALAQGTPFTGGSGILVTYPELRPVARRLALGLSALSLTLGVLFLVRYRMSAWYLLYMLLGNLLGWFYTAPPLRLAYRGWGEVATTLTIGLLIPGLGFLSLWGDFTSAFLLFTAPILLFGLAFIVAVQIPDLEADRAGGKQTLVARRGRRRGFGIVGLAVSLGTLYYLLLGLLRTDKTVNFLLPALFALPALAAGWAGALLHPEKRGVATRIVNALLLSFVLLLLAIDLYLTWLLLP
ncbi:MAG: prenyltransferase [Anaerolineales bacterium]